MVGEEDLGRSFSMYKRCRGVKGQKDAQKFSEREFMVVTRGV